MKIYNIKNVFRKTTISYIESKLIYNRILKILEKINLSQIIINIYVRNNIFKIGIFKILKQSLIAIGMIMIVIFIEIFIVTDSRKNLICKLFKQLKGIITNY